jgi:C1A family cysteine protease
MNLLFVLVISIVCLGLAFASEEEANVNLAFNSFIHQYDRSYTRNEFEYRFNIFRENYELIKKHNRGNHSYTMRVNQFADMTYDEFVAQYTGLSVNEFPSINKLTIDLSSVLNVPDSVDWRQHGVVSEVKNQGQCGSCWAFSVTGAVEGAYAIKTGKLISLSEQQLVDCSRPEGPQGCKGGWMDDAMKYILDNRGICSEDSYPYHGVEQTCQSQYCQNSAYISRIVDVARNNEQALKAAVSLSPVSVSIEANFQFYHGGVFDGPCGTAINHAVLIVGYGEENGKKYWLVKNSWGTGFGDQGYIKLAREIGTPEGQCGIAIIPSYPIV